MSNDFDALIALSKNRDIELDPFDLVYWGEPPDWLPEEQELVFGPRVRVEEIADLRSAMAQSRTWAEFASRISTWALIETLKMAGITEDAQTFDQFLAEEGVSPSDNVAVAEALEYFQTELDGRVPLFNEDLDELRARIREQSIEVGLLYPSEVKAAMTDWLPDEIFDHVELERAPYGDYPVLPGEREDELVATLVKHGYRCERADELMLRASGWDDAG